MSEVVKTLIIVDASNLDSLITGVFLENFLNNTGKYNVTIVDQRANNRVLDGFDHYHWIGSEPTKETILQTDEFAVHSSWIQTDNGFELNTFTIKTYLRRIKTVNKELSAKLDFNHKKGDDTQETPSLTLLFADESGLADKTLLSFVMKILTRELDQRTCFIDMLIGYYNYRVTTPNFGYDLKCAETWNDNNDSDKELSFEEKNKLMKEWNLSPKAWLSFNDDYKQFLNHIWKRTPSLWASHVYDKYLFETWKICLSRVIHGNEIMFESIPSSINDTIIIKEHELVSFLTQLTKHLSKMSGTMTFTYGKSKQTAIVINEYENLPWAILLVKRKNKWYYNEHKYMNFCYRKTNIRGRIEYTSIRT